MACPFEAIKSPLLCLILCLRDRREREREREREERESAVKPDLIMHEMSSCNRERKIYELSAKIFKDRQARRSNMKHTVRAQFYSYIICPDILFQHVYSKLFSTKFSLTYNVLLFLQRFFNAGICS